MNRELLIGIVGFVAGVVVIGSVMWFAALGPATERADKATEALLSLTEAVTAEHEAWLKAITR